MGGARVQRDRMRKGECLYHAETHGDSKGTVIERNRIIIQLIHNPCHVRECPFSHSLLCLCLPFIHATVLIV